MTDISKELTKLSVANKKEAIKACEQAIEIVKKFDGKPWGKRIGDALHSANDCLYLNKNKDYDGCNKFELKFYFKNRYVQTPDNRGGLSTFYIKDVQESILWSFHADSVDAENVIKLINLKIEYLKQKIESMLYTLKNAKKIKAKRAKLIEELKNLMDKTDLEVCEYCNISTETLWK